MIRIGQWDKEYWNIVREWKDLSRSNPTKIKAQLIGLIGRTCLEFLKNLTPKDSGDTANGWYISQQSDSVVEISNDNDELIDILDKGTSGHIIRGNPVLRFNIDGNDVFATQVFHPGTTPQPFMNQVLVMVDSLILDFVEAVLAAQSPLFKSGHIPKSNIHKTSNIAGIAGLGGPNRNQGRGRIHITPVRTGRRLLKRRIGLRRRTGHFINQTDIEIG